MYPNEVRPHRDSCGFFSRVNGDCRLISEPQHKPHCVPETWELQWNILYHWTLSFAWCDTMAMLPDGVRWGGFTMKHLSPWTFSFAWRLIRWQLPKGVWWDGSTINHLCHEHFLFIDQRIFDMMIITWRCQVGWFHKWNMLSNEYDMIWEDERCQVV